MTLQFIQPSVTLFDLQISRPLFNRYAGKLESKLKILSDGALGDVRSDLSQSIAPYSRYVKTEGDWLNYVNKKLDSGMSSAHNLRSRINKACQ